MADYAIEARLDKIEALLKSQVLFTKPSLTLEEAAIYTGYSKNTLYKFHGSGSIPAHKPGGKCLRFNRRDLDSFLSTDRPTLNTEDDE